MAKPYSVPTVALYQRLPSWSPVTSTGHLHHFGHHQPCGRYIVSHFEPEMCKKRRIILAMYLTLLLQKMSDFWLVILIKFLPNLQFLVSSKEVSDCTIHQNIRSNSSTLLEIAQDFVVPFWFKMAHRLVWDDRNVGRHKPKQPNSHQKSEDRLCAYVFLLLTLIQT